MRKLILILSILALALSAHASNINDMATMLMRSTFKIEGPARNPGKKSTGTIFVLGQPVGDSDLNQFIMVTAQHVLQDILGEKATIHLTEQKPDGSFKKRKHTFLIRKNGKALWTQHPRMDVAVMLLPLPREYVATLRKSMTLVGTALLADDAILEKNNLRVGEELSCLGFPFGMESNTAGFPILRSGRIASFPVYPSKQAEQILIDMRIFGGNSGGPVFFDFVDRRTFNSGPDSLDWRGIVGVISKDISHVQKIDGYFESGTRRDPLGIAVVIPAQFIKETLDLMNDNQLKNTEHHN